MSICTCGHVCPPPPVPASERTYGAPRRGTVRRADGTRVATCKVCGTGISWSDRYDSWQHWDNEDSWCPLPRELTLRDDPRYRMRTS